MVLLGFPYLINLLLFLQCTVKITFYLLKDNFVKRTDLTKNKQNHFKIKEEGKNFIFKQNHRALI